MVLSQILNFDKEKGEIIINFLDVDDFRLFNLNYGYERGNLILKEIKYYIELLPNINECIILGNDEFIFSCKGTFNANREDLFNLLLKISKSLNVTVSIGVSLSKNDNSGERLMNQLRYNLIIAKENGKNKICFR